MIIHSTIMGSFSQKFKIINFEFGQRLWLNNGKACFFAFSLIIEGTTEKALKFIVNLQQKLWFHWTKKYFWTLQRVSSNKNSINWHHFAMKKISVDLFRGVPIWLCLYYTKIHCSIDLRSQVQGFESSLEKKVWLF